MRKAVLLDLSKYHRLFVFNYANLILSAMEAFEKKEASSSLALKSKSNKTQKIKLYLERSLPQRPETFSNFPIGQLHIYHIYSLIMASIESSRRDEFAFELGMLCPLQHHRLVELILKVNPTLSKSLNDLADHYNLINPNHQLHLIEGEMTLISKFPQMKNDRVSLYFEMGWIINKLIHLFNLENKSFREIKSHRNGLSLTLTKSQLKFKSPKPEPNLKKILHRQAADTLGQLFGFDISSIEDPVMASTISFVLKNIHSNQVNLENIAVHLNMSERTLQRIYDRGNTSFSQILQHIRSEVAKQMLEVPNIRVTSIAQHLGYSESSSFNRAFKKWEGISPLNYRKKYNQ